jgi:hypothetical protein
MNVLGLNSPSSTVGHYLERNSPSLLQAIRILDDVYVAKDIVAAVIRLNKSIAFFEPGLNGAVLHLDSQLVGITARNARSAADR